MLFCLIPEINVFTLSIIKLLSSFVMIAGNRIPKIIEIIIIIINRVTNLFCLILFISSFILSPLYNLFGEVCIYEKKKFTFLDIYFIIIIEVYINESKSC